MKTQVTLVLGPAGAGMSARLWERAGTGSALWLVPTRRQCEEVRRVEPGSDVVTFPALARRVAFGGSVKRLLPETHQRLLLDHVLGDARGRLTDLADFVGVRGFGDAVFSLLSELKGLGVLPDAFRDRAAQLGERPRDRDIALIYETYQRVLTENGWLDRDAVYLLAIQRLGDHGRPAARPGTVVLIDGFTEFTPPQLTFLEKLVNHSAAHFITLPIELGEANAELYSKALNTLGALERLFPGAETVIVPRIAGDRPVGMTHLADNLFRDNCKAGEAADGVQCVEAPGLTGEVRLVARAVKALLLDGDAPGEVLVGARDLGLYAGLIDEMFTEYGIPYDLERAAPLSAEPAVRTLLRAARFPDDGWPFAATAALLRNSLFRPAWPETGGDPDCPAEAELVLRGLGEPRGREHYLAAVRRWAEAPETPLEDEEPESSHRRRRHEAARRCEPFLRRFFAAWDGWPARSPYADHVAWLKRFADDLGIGTGEPADAAALGLLWDELEGWATRERRGAISRDDFLELLNALASANPAPPAEPLPGRVRVVPAELATGLSYDHLFLLGLGERGFPKPAGGGPLYDGADREAFRGVGIDLKVAAEQLPSEMLLFYRLLVGARRSVTLSYPAVDEKGQDLLPGAFYRHVRALLPKVPVARRQLLMEGLTTDRPLGPAEYRVRWAMAGGDESALPEGQAHHLRAAKAVVTARFQERSCGPFDGLLADPSVRRVVADRFGPGRAFTATALERYVACPFKFFMGDVLGLSPLEEPSEDVEHSRRGAAYHRALARMHRAVRQEPQPFGGRLAAELESAAAEYAERASSPAVRVLWRLEGERLRRSAARFDRHADEFHEPWADTGGPALHDVEVEFGESEPITAATGENELRLTGRIDRIDVLELDDGSLGFWVIDYKTGRALSKGADARSLALLQLPVYALAAERLLGADRCARPLGLLYWMPMAKGPSLTLPANATDWFATDGWPELRAKLVGWLGELARRVRSGQFPLRPRSENCTATCEFSRACRISQSRQVEKDWELLLPGEGV